MLFTTKRIIISLVVSNLILLSLIGYYLLSSPFPTALIKDNASDIGSFKGRYANFSLFVIDANHEKLVERQVELKKEDSDNLNIKTVVATLTNDINSGEILNKPIELKDVFIYNQTAIINIDSRFRKDFNGGIVEEELLLESLFRTIQANSESIDKLKILIDDEESELFISHLDISNELVN
ncbi:MAG: GerMN domain-containing protein [Nitrospinota bacterium]